jgi:GTPase
MKSGFATILGRSNVGKSTLLNRLIGTKVAITTPKPQTTRRPIQGIYTTDEGQIVFVDTPGIMQKSRDGLTKKLLEFVKESLKGVEVVLYVCDPTRAIGNEEKQALKLVENITLPKLLVINKMDDRKSKDYLEMYRALEKDFDAVVEVSAKTGSNLNYITEWIYDRLKEGEFMYPPHQVSNISREEQLSEIIREKLFLRLRQEVPYSTHVVVHNVEEKKNGTIHVDAVIYTSDDRYKSMIIGKGGQGIREIGQAARKELEGASGKRFYLALKVDVDKRWVETSL